MNISEPLVIATAPVLDTLISPSFFKFFVIKSISLLKAVICITYDFFVLSNITGLYFFDNEKWIQFLVIFEKLISILFGLALTALGASIDLKKIFNQGYVAILIGMTFSIVSLVSVTFLIFILGLNVL